MISVILSLCPGLLAPSLTAEEAKLVFLSEGGMSRIGFYSPKSVALTSEKPEGITKMPAVKAAKYAAIPFGVNGAKVMVIVDEPSGPDAKLYVDTNRNDDLTDDAPARWNFSDQTAQGKRQRMHQGSGRIDIPLGKATQTATLGIYRFHPEDRPEQAMKLFYYRDYALAADLKLGDKSYRATVSDEATSGSFASAVLMIDVNGNGRIDSKGEIYDPKKPFNIGGTTYEVKQFAPEALHLEIGLSATEVAEVLPPPDLRVGRKAPEFKAKPMDGKSISFPTSFKGKLVLVDFWATWCGPCIEELPNLLKAYNEFHPKGLEVLGISFDDANEHDKVAGFTKERGMSWAHVYEGKGWSTEIGTLYGIESIPSAFLVDGDTGEILAVTRQLRGEAIMQTIRDALAKKAAKK